MVEAEVVAGSASDELAAVAPRVWEVESHPFDSGADLKRHLEKTHGEEWGLTGTSRQSSGNRGTDRYDCLVTNRTP